MVAIDVVVVVVVISNIMLITTVLLVYILHKNILNAWMQKILTVKLIAIDMNYEWPACINQSMILFIYYCLCLFIIVYYCLALFTRILTLDYHCIYCFESSFSFFLAYVFFFYFFPYLDTTTILIYLLSCKLSFIKNRYYIIKNLIPVIIICIIYPWIMQTVILWCWIYLSLNNVIVWWWIDMDNITIQYSNS